MRAYLAYVLLLLSLPGMLHIAARALPAPPDMPDVQFAVMNVWVQIGIMIVSALISYALAPKPPKPKPAALEDFSVPTAEEGREIPVVFGEVWLQSPNVLWYGDLRSEPIKKGGKK